MYIRVEPIIDSEGILNQIAKIQELSIKLKKETYKIEEMIERVKIYEKGDSEESQEG